MKRAGVIGAGSWGTALAVLLANRGIDTTLWSRNPAFAEKIGLDRENSTYLPGFGFPDGLMVTSDVLSAVRDQDVLVFVVPSHGLRRVAETVSEALSGGRFQGPKAVVSATKGIENETLLTMTDVLEEVLPSGLAGKIAAISGPSFAREVAAGLPTAVTVAATDHRLCAAVQEFFSTDTFRVYTSLDPIGVQLGGALKNVIAIASGISDGMGFGTNTRAALITRGLAEIARLGMCFGANPLTFAGLAGLGDLVLTCTGDLSRNRQVGLKLGQGWSVEAIQREMNMVAEGIKTSRSAHALAEKHGVEMPIAAQVYSVLYEGRDPKDAVRELLARPLRQELGDVFA
jgi:glycerol-3-phosphate dehydrogenase (NAD(P)+)